MQRQNLAAGALQRAVGDGESDGNCAQELPRNQLRSRAAARTLSLCGVQRERECHNNRALFEIPDFLEQILERNSSGAAGSGSPAVTKITFEQAAGASLTSRLESSYVK